MLNTVVNPMLNLLGGGGNRGNQLIQTGGTLNSLSGTLTPLFVGALIGQVSDKTAMSDVTPLLFIAMAVFVASFFILFFIAIPEPQEKAESKGGFFEEIMAPLKFRHCMLGIIGIFFYVGIEIGIPSQLTFYLSKSAAEGGVGLENGAAIGGAIAAMYWMLMLVGRFSSSLISGKVSTRTQMITVSITAITLLVIAIFLPSSNTISMPGYIAKIEPNINPIIELYNSEKCFWSWKIHSSGFWSVHDHGCWWWYHASHPEPDCYKRRIYHQLLVGCSYAWLLVLLRCCRFKEREQRHKGRLIF